MKRTFLLFALIAATVYAADTLPTDRPSSWARGTYTGVPGGIPSASWTDIQDVTVHGADPTGVSSSQAAYDAARTAGGVNSVVYFPAGTYRLASMVGKTDQVVRGAGMFTTTIKFNGDYGYISGADENNWGAANGSFEPYGNVTSGGTKGSSVIQVQSNGNGEAFRSNTYAHLRISHDPALIFSYKDLGDYAARTMVNHVITSTVVGSTTPPTYELTLAVPLPTTIAQTIVVLQPQNVGSFAVRKNLGIENLTLDGDGNAPTYGVKFNDLTWKAWAWNVRVKNHDNQGFYIEGSTNVEVRGCFVEASVGWGPSHNGIFMASSSGALIENNIIVKNYAGILVQSGSIYNAISSNFMLDCPVPLTSAHNAQPFANLYEGNLTPNGQADNYHGGSSHDTFHRNWVLTYDKPRNATTGLPLVHDATTFNFTTGMLTTWAGSYGLSIKRWGRYHAINGNIFGVPGQPVSANPDSDYIGFGGPNMGNGFSYGTASLLSNPPGPWEDWDATIPGPARWTGTVSAVNGIVDLTVDISGGSALSKLDSRISTAVTNFFWANYKAAWLLRPATGAEVYLESGVARSGSTVQLFQPTNNSQPFPAVGTAVTLFPGIGGFQEIDNDVEATATLKGNKLFNGTAVRTAMGGSDTIAASYIHASTPAFFGSKTFPAFGPDKDNTALTLRSIPAGDNYLTYLEAGSFVTEDTGAVPTVSTPTFTPSNPTQTAAFQLTIDGATSAATYYFTTNGDTPTILSTLYDSGNKPTIPLGTTTVKAIGVKAEHNNSAVRAVTYVVTADGGATITTLNVGTLNLQ